MNHQQQQPEPRAMIADMQQTRKSSFEVSFVDDIDRISATLSPHHSEYLLRRHATVRLQPLPDPTDADPLNWPQWKKTVNLILVASHACMGTFTGASAIPAFENIARDLNVSIQQASYLTSLQIAIIGIAPFLWLPLSNRFGRRPIFLMSLICSLLCNIGCAKSTSYGSMAACRALVAFFISPAGAIGTAVVQETFFLADRARYMGIWVLMITVGVPLSPFIFGFVTKHLGYRWIFWILAISNAVQFVFYFIFGPETRYLRGSSNPISLTVDSRYPSIRRIDPSPFTMSEILHPLAYFGRLRVLIPAAACAMVFLFGSVLITVELPQLFIAKFHFDSQTIGLQFIGLIIGSILGELLGGTMSDAWMTGYQKRNQNRRPINEHRLWLSYTGFLFTICGVVVFLQMTQKLDAYNISPIVGCAIAAAGTQIVITVLVTYAVDCYSNDAANVGVFITFIRQIWGFIGPFWFPQMFKTLGANGSTGICVALISAISIVPTVALHIAGASRKQSTGGGTV